MTHGIKKTKRKGVEQKTAINDVWNAEQGYFLIVSILINAISNRQAKRKMVTFTLCPCSSRPGLSLGIYRVGKW